MSTEVNVVRFIESDTEFIEKTGTCINTIGEGENIDTWLYFPFWLKRIGKGQYVEYSFEKLPQEVKNMIESLKEYQNKQK